MIVYVAAVASESGDHRLFASRERGDLDAQVVAMARHEYGPPEDNEGWEEDGYASYEHWLVDHYHVQVEDFDL